MSEARGQPEPSMEEILASIRRIISEDGAPAQDSGDRAPDSAEPAAVASGSPEAPAGPPQSQPSESPPAPLRLDDSDDALLLTEMVADDGTIVSLAGGPAAESPIEAESEPPLPEAPAPEPPAPEAVAAEPGPEPLAATDRVEIEDPDLAPLEIEAEPEPEPEPEMAPEPAPEPVEVLDPADEPEPEISVSPSEAEPEADLADEQEAPTMPEAAKRSVTAEESGEGLLSDTTLSASASALAQLSRTVRRDKDFPLGGGRMVEDLVREALEPMLKEWLDANLAGIVERLVRQEIERMVRRAEEDS